MKAGIVTIPNTRDVYLYPLIDVLEQSGCEVKLFVDYNRQGHTWNLQQALEGMLDDAGKDEPVLITMDDVITKPKWINDWREIHSETKTDLYSLFTRRPHLKKFASQGFYKGVVKRGFYDHASIYINQQGLNKRVQDWLQKEGKEFIPEKRRSHYDVCVQDYFVYNNTEWTTAVPCLFEHIGDVSTLGHNIGKAISYKYEDI